VKAIDESQRPGEDVDIALVNEVGDLARRPGRVPSLQWLIGCPR
jgi:hypothetical protein